MPTKQNLMESYVLPWVREAQAYSDAHMDYAWDHPQVLRMMSNENPLPPSEEVLQAVVEAARNAHLYPGSGRELRARIAQEAGLGPENVLLGNGSTDIINIVVNTFVAPGDEVVIPVPTFSMYEARVRVSGGVPVRVPLRADFTWDVEAILNAVGERTKLLVICTPNNPTGNEIPEHHVRRLLDLGLPTLVDEAYYELKTDRRSYADLIPEYPNLIVSRTFSKAYGLAGLRVGYALAQEAVIAYLRRVRLPWNVSLVSLAAALAELQDQADRQRKVRYNAQGRQQLLQRINQIRGLKAYPSQGNFVLIDASCLGKTSEQIKEDLLARGVFIRPMSPHHMPEGFVRVTVGTPQQNERFLQILSDYVKEQKGGE
jgi:histidinol-phosphate aminotransferase